MSNGVPDPMDKDLVNVSKEQLDLIYEIEKKLLANDFDLNAFMDAVVNEMLVLTPATAVVIELVENDMMVYEAASGTAKDHVGLKLKQKGSISGLCVEMRKILRSDDTEHDPRVNLEAVRKVQARSLLVAPLFQGDKAVGVLKILSNQPHSFSDVDVKILQIITNFLASALYRQILQEYKNFF